MIVLMLPGNYSNKQTALRVLSVLETLLNRRRQTSKNPGMDTQKWPIISDVSETIP